MGKFYFEATHQFPDISVVEDATMYMAELAGLETARHGLIQLRSGELAYVTKRLNKLLDERAKVLET